MLNKSVSSQSDIEEVGKFDFNKSARSRLPSNSQKSQANQQLVHSNSNKSNNDLMSYDSQDKVILQNNSINRGPANQRYINSLIKQVKILTYNIFLRPPPIKNNKDDYKNERTKLFLNSINDFDIICFQELFGFLNQRKHKIIFNGMKQGYFYHASSPSPSFFSSYLVDGGLVTISRFPIVEKVYKPYKYGVLSDNLSQKGVLYTKIQVNDSHIHLFNTHLQASYVGAENNVKATVITRIDQLKLMRDFIKEMVNKHKESETDAIMICGDFNVNARQHSYPMHFLNDVPDLQTHMQSINKNEFSEYDVLMHILSDSGKNELVDTLRVIIFDQILQIVSLKVKFSGESPITYADTYVDKTTNQEFPLEEALTIKEDLLQKTCLDYIMQLKIPQNSLCENLEFKDEEVNNEIKQKQSDVNASNAFKVDYEQVLVETFFVKNQPFTQLSDHYGVSASLRYVMHDQPIHKQSIGCKDSVISSHNNKQNSSSNRKQDF